MAYCSGCYVLFYIELCVTHLCFALFVCHIMILCLIKNVLTYMLVACLKALLLVFLLLVLKLLLCSVYLFIYCTDFRIVLS